MCGLGWCICSGGTELNVGGLGAIRSKLSLPAAGKTRSTADGIMFLGVLLQVLLEVP